MKFVILAATIGYVFGADDGAVGGDCTTADHATVTGGGTAITCTGENFCDTSADTLGQGTFNTVEANEATSGICTALTPTTGDCSTVACVSTDYCLVDSGASTSICTPLIVSGSTDACVADGDCATDVEATTVCRAATCAGDKTCDVPLSPADGEVGGCCSDTIAIETSIAAANYCKKANDGDTNGIVTANLLADGADCVVADPQPLCASGGCTVKPDPNTDTTAGTCDVTPIAAGADGGNCKPVIEAAAKIDEVACTDSSHICSPATDDGVASWCQTDGGSEAADTTTPAAAGALQGACNAEVPAVTAQAACTSPLVCTGFVAAAADGTGGATGTCGAADDSPAAIFYGMSMVTAAVAYLL